MANLLHNNLLLKYILYLHFCVLWSHVFFVNDWECVHCLLSRRSGQCWECPGTHRHVTLVCTIYLRIVADQIHPLVFHKGMLFPDSAGKWPCSGMIFTHENEFEVFYFAYRFHRVQSNQTSVECASLHNLHGLMGLLSPAASGIKFKK